MTFVSVSPAAAGLACFPPGIKGQRRPARYTRPAPTMPRMLRSGSPSTALAMVAGSIGLTARIEAWCPPAVNGGSTTLSVTACPSLGGDAPTQPPIDRVVCSILYTQSNMHRHLRPFRPGAATQVRGRWHAGSFGARTAAEAACCTLVQVVQTNAIRLHAQSGPRAALEIGSG